MPQMQTINCQSVQASIISSTLLASKLMKVSAYKYKEANEIMSNCNKLQSLLVSGKCWCLIGSFFQFLSIVLKKAITLYAVAQLSF